MRAVASLALTLLQFGLAASGEVRRAVSKLLSEVAFEWALCLTTLMRLLQPFAKMAFGGGRGRAPYLAALRGEPLGERGIEAFQADALLWTQGKREKPRPSRPRFFLRLPRR